MIKLKAESEDEPPAGIRRVLAKRSTILLFSLPLLALIFTVVHLLAAKHAENMAMDFVRSKNGILGGGHSILRLPIPGMPGFNRLQIGSACIPSDQLTDEMVDHLQNIPHLSSVGLYHPSDHEQIMNHTSRKEDWIVLKSIESLNHSLSEDSADKFEELVSNKKFYASKSVLNLP